MLESFKLDHPVKCPACENEYNHMQKVEVYTGGDEYAKNRQVIVDKGLNIQSKQEVIKTENRCREIGVIMNFKCEGCENSWEIEYAFHKGQYFNRYEPVNG